MPSKVFQCDFCDSQHRKMDLPTHIRSKHTAELAQHLIHDAKTCSISIIWSFIKKASPKTMPIPSKLHDGSDYWFGVRPIMIEEKDNVTPYLAIEANLESHAKFINELMTHVSLVDFMEIHRNQQLNSQEMADMRKRNRDMSEFIAEISEQHAKVVEKLQTELDDYKQTVEQLNGGTTIAEMRMEITTAQRNCSAAEKKSARLAEELSSLQWKYNTIETRYDELYKDSYSEDKSRRMIEMEEAYIKRIEHLQSVIQKEREKVATVKKEGKSVDKKKADKEKMKNELKVAKAKARALKKQLKEESSSDSDSHSDDDE